MLQEFLFHGKTILVPDKVRHLRIPSILLHASFKEAEDVRVVGVVCELEFSAVSHEFFEFFWVPFAELVNCNF